MLDIRMTSIGQNVVSFIHQTKLMVAQYIQKIHRKKTILIKSIPNCQS